MKLGSGLMGTLYAAGVLAVVGFACSKAEEKPAAADKPAAAEKLKALPPGAAKKLQPKAGDIYKVDIGQAVQLGPKDAPVTIVEFSDFQCPYCGRGAKTMHELKEAYGDKIRLVFKHFPLPFHKDAPLAAKYAMAAGEQGKFWEMHDLLFANQKKLKEEDLKVYASKLNLDQGKVDAFVASDKGDNVIKADMAQGQKIGVRGTPAFFINGERMVGARPYDQFDAVVKRQLARADALKAKGVSGEALYAELVKDGRTTAPPPPERKPAPAPVRQAVKLEKSTPSKGSGKPLVTIVEFSDFQCPFCSRVNPTIEKILETYGDKVQLRFRNNPLPFHKQAMPAAKLALAAQEAGKFWPMHDKLFANQKKLMPEDLKAYAKELGVNMADKPEYAARIAADQAAAQKWGSRGTPGFFVNGVMVRGAQPFANFKTVIDKEIALAEKLMKEGVKREDVYAEVIKRYAGKPTGPAPRAAAPAAPKGPVKINLGEAPVQGPAKAPVTLVMWSDFQCPFCGRVNPSIERVKKEYGDKVKIAFKQFPLGFHKNARPAAIASLAAQRQGKFWEMHEVLFKNQKALTRPDFVGYAKELGLDVAKFEKDLDDPLLDARVSAEMAEGQKVGVRGTPATFINGIMVSGAVPYERFKTVIDGQLAKK